MSFEWNGDRLFARIRGASMVGLLRGAETVREAAVRLIMSPPKTGRIYRRRGVSHQASAPGEAPANDTGRLAGSIRVEPNFTATTVSVVASTEYAEHLEYGTQTMEPRPFMRPALAESRDAIEAAVIEEIGAALS